MECDALQGPLYSHGFLIIIFFPTFSLQIRGLQFVVNLWLLHKYKFRGRSIFHRMVFIFIVNESNWPRLHLCCVIIKSTFILKIQKLITRDLKPCFSFITDWIQLCWKGMCYNRITRKNPAFYSSNVCR